MKEIGLKASLMDGGNKQAIIKINMKEFGNTTKDMVKVKFKKKGVYKW